MFHGNVKSCFLGENNKNISLSSAEFAQRVVKVRVIYTQPRLIQTGFLMTWLVLVDKTALFNFSVCSGHFSLLYN